MMRCDDVMMRCDAFCGHFTAAVTGHAYGTLHPACLPAVSDACLPAPTCARSLASRGSTYSGYIHRLRLSMASPSSSLVGSGDSRDRDASYYYCTHGAGSGADTVRVGTAANLHHSANCSGKLRMHFSRSRESRSDSDVGAPQAAATCHVTGRPPLGWRHSMAWLYHGMAVPCSCVALRCPRTDSRELP